MEGSFPEKLLTGTHKGHRLSKLDKNAGSKNDKRGIDTNHT